MSSINPESIRAVAKKDVQDSIRSWMFIGLSVFFFTLLVGVTLFLAWAEPDITGIEGAGTEILVGFVSEITRLVIPLIALLLGWKSIAGERETGSMKVLLSMPHSRSDVLLGKWLGRSIVLSFSLVVGFVLAAVVVAATFGQFDVLEYGGLLGMSIVYGLAYISIAVALSSIARSTTVAGAAMVGVFVLFYVIWNSLTVFYQLLAQRGVPFFEMVEYSFTVTMDGEEFVQSGQRPANWMMFVMNLDPGEAYARALSLVADTQFLQVEAAVEDIMFEGDIPFYLQDWFVFIILLAWIVVPMGIALYRFDQIDL